MRLVAWQNPAGMASSNISGLNQFDSNRTKGGNAACTNTDFNEVKLTMRRRKLLSEKRLLQGTGAGQNCVKLPRVRQCCIYQH